MRAIAQDAGVSTGNAYYYFGSKEELIQQFYVHNQAEHLAACRPVLAAETEFAPRLRGTLRALIDVSGAVSRVRRPVLQARGRAEQPAEPAEQGIQPGPRRRARLSTPR